MLFVPSSMHPFGMVMPERSFSSGNYRYGFNGKENDNEVKGEGNQQDYGMRIYDPRAARFLSVDPLTKDYSHLSPYAFAENKPIAGIDLDGLEFVLTIYDPNVSSGFIAQINTWQDVYGARKTAFNAINSQFTAAEKAKVAAARSPQDLNAPGGFTPKFWSLTDERASLSYDKDAASGLTINYNRQQGFGDHYMVWGETIQFGKSSAKGLEDKDYPVDVRIIESPDYGDTYKDWDFVGKYFNTNVSLWTGTSSRGTMHGHLKGAGYVVYDVDAIGVGSSIFGGYGLGGSGGYIYDNATDKSQLGDPSLLAGWGAQVGGSASVGVGVEGGVWGGFASQDDAVNFNTQKATIQGIWTGFNAGLRAGYKKLPSKDSGKKATPAVSYATLQQPKS